MRLSRRRLLAGLGSLTLAPWVAALPAWAEPSSLATAVLAVHGGQGPHRLQVEVADTPARRARGLMERESLAEDAGMLFVYAEAQPPGSAFWMYRTRLPLDIAFIDGEGRIAAIRRMPPCASSDAADCPSYAAGVAHVAALEVNAGYFAARGIAVGDCLTLPGGAGACRP